MCIALLRISGDQWQINHVGTWYARVSHPKILPPDEESPPRPTNQKQLMEKEHAREIPDTLVLIRDCLRMADQALASRDKMIKEDLLEFLSQISSTD